MQLLAGSGLRKGLSGFLKGDNGCRGHLGLFHSWAARRSSLANLPQWSLPDASSVKNYVMHPMRGHVEREARYVVSPKIGEDQQAHPAMADPVAALTGLGSMVVMLVDAKSF